jgi:hypothetical protein
VVMNITEPDWTDTFDLERAATAKTAMIELSAVSTYDGTTATPIYARAPGTIGKSHGDINSYDNYVIVDQDECNRIAGCLLAVENNPYEPLEIKLSANNRLLDIAPRMFCTISIAEADTPRGVVITSARIIPRSVSYEWNKDSSVLLTTVTFEFEAIGVDGIEYHPPTVEDNNLDMGIGMNGLDFPAMDSWFPPTVPPTVTTPCNQYVHNSFSLSWSPKTLSGNGTRISQAYFPCMLRSSGSYIIIPLLFYGDAATKFAVYGVKDGSRVITGTLTVGSPTIVTFNPISDLQVDGFEMELEESNTGTVWDQDYGVQPFGGTSSYNSVVDEFPSPKQVHFIATQTYVPYKAQFVAHVLLEPTTPGDLTVGARCTVRLNGTKDYAGAVQFISLDDARGNTFYHSGDYGATVSIVGIISYNGSTYGQLFIESYYNPTGWPQDWGKRDFEMWITLDDEIGRRAIALSVSTIYDVCAI